MAVESRARSAFELTYYNKEIHQNFRFYSVRYIYIYAKNIPTNKHEATRDHIQAETKRERESVCFGATEKRLGESARELNET